MRARIDSFEKDSNSFLLNAPPPNVATMAIGFNHEFKGDKPYSDHGTWTLAFSPAATNSQGMKIDLHSFLIMGLSVLGSCVLYDYMVACGVKSVTWEDVLGGQLSLQCLRSRMLEYGRKEIWAFSFVAEIHSLVYSFVHLLIDSFTNVFCRARSTL